MNEKTEQKDSMNCPRYIFAIGGAGKNLLYTMLEKEWILREIIRPKFSSSSIDVIIVDTALNEENNDKEKIREIESKIKELEDEYRSDPIYVNKNIGRININYKLLTKEMVLQSPYDLIGIGNDVKMATGTSVWWINDPQLGENWHKKIINRENFKEMNFSKGVYRKRAIGKAIYYKAISEGLFNIDIIQSAQVDIIVGLGGGTGSGMAFDLARRLKSIQPTADITLFGILSTLDESPDEKANSFAMISELEYARLNDNTFRFKDIVLIPMEVTRYPGKEKASDEHERLLKEFDETFPYILISYHNNPAQLLFANLPDYSPFIIATPQLVRYNVDSIRKFKDKLIQALQDKEISLKDEESIYNTIRKYIEEFYAQDFKNEGLPDEDKSFLKEEKYVKFENMLRHDFFKELEYNSVIHIKKAVDAGIIGSVSDDIERQIPSIKSEVDAIVIGDRNYRDDVDSMLFRILKKDIETIEILKNILNMVNRVPEDIVKDTLKIIIKVDESSLGRKLNQIREEIDNLNIKNKRLDNDTRILEDSNIKYEDEIRKETENKNNEWKQNTNRDMGLLDSIDRTVITSNNNFINLKVELNDYAIRINSHNSIKTIDADSTKNIEEILNKIYDDLEEIGLHYEDKSLIMKNLSSLKELKKLQIESGRRIPLLDKIIGVVLKTDRVKKQKDAKNKISLKKVEINNGKVFEIDPSYSTVYGYNIEDKINDKKNEIINSIIEKTKENYFNTLPFLFTDLRKILETEKRNGANIDDIIRSHLGYEIEKNKRENELKSKREEIFKTIDKVKKIKNLEVILKSIIPSLKSHSEHLKNYNSHVTNIGKDIQTMHRAKKDTIRYIMELQPVDIFKATAVNANINNILEDGSEELLLKQNLQDAIERTIDNRYNLLSKRVIETNDHEKRWEKLKVMNSLITIANINPEFIDSQKIISDAFSLRRENYSNWKCQWGDAWGAGVVLFIAGVPFDNIQNIIDPRAGYYRYYNGIDTSGDMIFFHHSYMLEDGKFIRRKKIFNFQKEDDKMLLFNNDREIKKTISENYEIIELQNAY